MVWPLAFFLVAVPWPTVIEGPLVQALTRANTAITVELVDLFGVPALQHGNVIEVGTGMVGIDEACSGIRSFQVTLMLALLFGEIYRLGVFRRLALCLLGFGLSFVFNVARTVLLTCVAAGKGTAAMERWHDLAGAAILVACFGALWLMARAGRGEGRAADAPVISSEAHSPGGQSAAGSSAFPRFGMILLSWLLLCEASTEAWYRYHEAKLSPPVTWTIQPPMDNPSLRQLPLSEKARQFLRYDEAVNASWDEGGQHFQAIFLRWKPGRTAVHLAKTHTPEACVTAAGRRLLSKSDVRLCRVAGLQLPFRAYVFEGNRAPLHVFYFLWEDRTPQRTFDSARLTYANRLAPVLAGRRLSGQRSLELAIWGCADGEAADAAMREQLAKIVRSPRSTVHRSPQSTVVKSPKFKVQGQSRVHSPRSTVVKSSKFKSKVQSPKSFAVRCASFC